MATTGQVIFWSMIILIVIFGSVIILILALSFSDQSSVGGSAADLRTIKANLTERLQAGEDKLSSVSAERDLLNASLTNLTEKMDKLQRLSTNLIKEKDRLQRLSTNLIKEKDRLQRLSTNLIKEKDRLQRWCKQKKTCPEGWRMLNSSCYLLSNKSGSWKKGRKDCRDKGADLVIIDSLEEQKFLTSIVTHRSWIGLTDRENEGTWKWIDGTPLTEAYWDLNEPNNGGGNQQLGDEDCAEIRIGRIGRKNWNDVPCNNSLHWICENLA